jgi:hypothetical protein
LDSMLSVYSQYLPMWWWTRSVGGDSQFDSANAVVYRVEHEPKGKIKSFSMM